MLNLEISPDTQLINEGRDDWGINHMQVTILPQTYDCALPAAYQYKWMIYRGSLLQIISF